MNLFTKQKNKEFIYINKFTSGFTLIELMVASTLFTIIMMMGVGSLVVSSNSAKSSQKLRTAVDNVNFAMESMTRELRTGKYYYCLEGGEVALTDNLTRDCTNGNGNIIVFTPPQLTAQSPLRIAYKIHTREGSNPTTYSLQRCDPICANVVSEDVDIQLLKFYVTGSSTIDSIQPSIKILIKGVVTVKGVGTPFTLQTMVSQRSSDEI